MKNYTLDGGEKVYMPKPRKISEEEAAATLKFGRELVQGIEEGLADDIPLDAAEMVDKALENLHEIKRPGVSRIIIELRGLHRGLIARSVLNGSNA